MTRLGQIVVKGTSGGDTSCGGSFEPLSTTKWTNILDARGKDPELRRQAIAALVERYWKPVYVSLRHRGVDNEKAKDLAQGFFCEIVLDGKLIQSAERSKGRFRTLLYAALKRYWISENRKATAQKRHPGSSIVSLSDVTGAGVDVPDPMAFQGPDQAFDYAWASILLDRVIQQVEAECQTEGQSAHWEIFLRRVIRPILDGDVQPPLSQLSDEFELSGARQAANMVATMRRRFQRAIRREMRQMVDSDGEVDEEINELIKILSGRRASHSDLPHIDGRGEGDLT